MTYFRGAVLAFFLCAATAQLGPREPHCCSF